VDVFDGTGLRTSLLGVDGARSRQKGERGSEEQCGFLRGIVENVMIYPVCLCFIVALSFGYEV
jgi:hypothetical protein